MPRDAHVIEEVHYAGETIVCKCGEAVTAAPDVAVPDRHEPLAEAWRQHRRRHGLGTPTIAQLAGLRRSDAPWSSDHLRSAAIGAARSAETRAARR